MRVDDNKKHVYYTKNYIIITLNYHDLVDNYTLLNCFSEQFDSKSDYIIIIKIRFRKGKYLMAGTLYILKFSKADHYGLNDYYIYCLNMLKELLQDYDISAYVVSYINFICKRLDVEYLADIMYHDIKPHIMPNAV